MDRNNKCKDLELVCCGLCPKSFNSRLDLYKHFHNRHNISQEFRGLKVCSSNLNHTDDDGVNSVTMVDKQIEECPSSRRQSRSNLYDRINRKAERLHTVTYSQSKVLDDTRSILASSSEISFTEKNVPSTLKHLPTAVGCSSTAAILNNSHHYPTSPSLNEGKTRPSHSTHHDILESAAHRSSYLTDLVNFSTDHRPQQWRPYAVGNIQMVLANKENSMTGTRNRYITESVHLAKDIPLFLPKTGNAHNDGVTIVNNPTDTI